MRSHARGSDPKTWCASALLSAVSGTGYTQTEFFSGECRVTMPIYEYQCTACKRKMSFLVLTPASFEPKCKYCKGTELEQLFSRFSSPKSEEQRLESLADPTAMSGLDENDPASVARWMKKMGKEMGEDVGEDFDQIAEEAAQEAASGQPATEGEDEGGAAPGSDDL